MCDTAEDMDEYIEYEFARDCIEIAEDEDDEGVEFVQQNPESLLDASGEHLPPEDNFLYEDDDEDYEVVEELDLDENVEQILISDPALDIKAEILENEEEEEVKEMSFKAEYMEDDVEAAQEDHLIDDEEMTNGFEQQQQQEQDLEKQQQQQLDQLPQQEQTTETQLQLPEETEDLEEIEYEEVRLEDTEEEIEQVLPDKEISNKSIKPAPQPCPEDKGPKGVARKYMLYDELVATIVDYDNDGTPIVEFSVSNNDADEKLPMECGICPDVMNRSKIPAHLRTHLVPGTNRYQCIYCEETYKDCKYLAGHARRHMGIRPYVCEICKLYFSTKQDLRVHNQRRHQEKDHICEVCGKTFAQNTQLKRHREATHEKKRRFECHLCPKSYYKNFSLQEHIRAVHMGKRRIIVCPFCGMQCRDAHKMARHRKQYHLHQTHFECHICNEEFTDINYFDAHKRSIQCRNNTRRKMEEEGLQQQQQEEADQQQQLLQTNKQEIFLEDDDEENSQQYSQHSTEQQQQHLLQTTNFHQQQNLQHQQHLQNLQQQTDDDDDALETVQILDENDYKHLIGSSGGHHNNTGQFMLNNHLLQQHKIEELTGDDVNEEGELVYEITIDSNE